MTRREGATAPKHTPGPWVLVEKYGKRERDGHPFVNRSIVTEYVHPQAKDRVPVVEVAQNSAGPCLWLSQEDGHLIAAAPDLLEAASHARVMIDHFLHGEEGDEALHDAHRRLSAAIAKAEGGEA